MKKNKRFINLFIVAFLGFTSLVGAQSLDRPVIWANDAERDTILNRINQYSWASSVKSKTKSVVDAKVNIHISSPASILGTIPAFATDDNVSEANASSANGGHAKATLYAAYSGMLYYLTQEEKYAQFSADIVSYYVDAMVDMDVDKMATSGSYFYDARTSYGNFAIAYDFIYDFLNKTGTQVYNKSTAQMVAFDNAKAQRMIEKLASNALQEHSGADTHGKTVSNHPILRAPGALFCVMAVDDDTERERLFNVFWEAGTKKQNSFKNTILPMFGAQGIWPESLSYSFMPGVTMVLNTIDRFKPEMNVMASYKNILEGNFLFDYLRMPSRYFVRYGDSKRKIDQTSTLYRYALDIAHRRGYQDIELKAKVALRQSYNANGGYTPSVSTSTFNAFSAFPHLFWGVDVPAQLEASIDFNKPTVILEHAGIALQRNYTSVNNKYNGLCGIIGGAHYVHSHVTGIAMELYGQGYVMGPNAGLCASLADRSKPEHTDYFRLYAGNNTVIVNGTSHGIQSGSWNSNSYVWMNTTQNIAAEPKHLQDPISDNFSFATQFLDDNVNNCDQQRTLSTIRTSPTTAYYFDMFRSKSLDDNKFHDYVYHNIGDEMHIMDEDNRTIAVSATSKYQTYYNDGVKSPGWLFFDDTQHTDSIDEAVNVRFDLDDYGKYMHMLTPAGVKRQYTKAMGPATREAPGDYLERTTPILAIRQAGEAWNKPFVHIFEPSSSVLSSVRSVEHLYSGDQIVGAKVISAIDNKTVEDYVLCLPNASSSVVLDQYGISFTGRFAVVRYEQDVDTALTSLYIGEGDSISFGNFSLSTGDDNKGFKVFGGAPYFGRQLLFKDLIDKQEIPLGTNLSIEAVVGDDYSEVSLWANDTLNLGTKTEGPFIWSNLPFLTDMQNEFYTFTLKAKDGQGQDVYKTIMISTPGQEPNTSDGKPHAVPGRIQFEDYDLGGLNMGYFDLSPQQTSDYTYRDSDLVDLGLKGTVVASIESDEWLEYTVNVEQAGFYKMKVRHCTEGFPSVESFSVIQANTGDTLLSSFNGLFTGYYTYYEDVAGEFFLDRGEQDLRIAMLNPGAKLDYMIFEYLSPAYQLAVVSEHGTVNVSSGEQYHNNGTSITLNAIPDEGYVFKSWSGDYTGADNPLELTFNNADISLIANFEQSSAIDNASKSTIRVYPNPSSGSFTIDLQDNHRVSYNVFRMNGAKILSGHVLSKSTLSLSSFGAGMYLLELDSPQGKEIRRIMIK